MLGIVGRELRCFEKLFGIVVKTPPNHSSPQGAEILQPMLDCCVPVDTQARRLSMAFQGSRDKRVGWHSRIEIQNCWTSILHRNEEHQSKREQKHSQFTLNQLMQTS